jgi:hypothetical protein
VVKDSDRGRRLASPIVRPSNVAGQNILGTLQPFEADDRSCRCFRVPGPDRRLGESVDLLAGGSWFDRFGAPILCYAAPGVRGVAVENIRIQPSA